MTYIITLGKSQEHALIDVENYHLIKKFKWYLSKVGDLKYAITTARIINNKIVPLLTISQAAKKRKRTINRFNKETLYNKSMKLKGILMHRLIMDCPKDLEIDHINRDGLDNRRENLRVCNRKENGRHRKLSKANTSGYHGVHYCNSGKRKKRWEATIRANGKKTYLGRFYTKEEAAFVYNKAAKFYHGEYATLNTISIQKT